MPVMPQQVCVACLLAAAVLHRFLEGMTMASAEQFPWKGIGLHDLEPESGDVQLVAMVDAAQVSSFSMLKWPWVRHAMLVEPLAEDRFNATPHLFELTDPQDIGRLAAKLEGQSVARSAQCVVARRPISALAAAIRRRLDAVLPDGLDCMNRFFDGRVALMSLLPSRQISAVRFALLPANGGGRARSAMAVFGNKRGRRW
jgi:hypothetical protein